MANRSRVFKAAFFVVGFAALLAASRLVLALIPYPELAAYRSRSYGLVIQDRNGAVLRVLPAEDGVKREWIDLEDIPPGAAGIFIRAEDRRFYFHPGVDPLAIAGSALRNFRAGRVVSGASTITMQLARLIRLHGPGVEGKLGEAWDALCLEARLSKKEILELWFNNIPFGSNIEGLSAMARARFGISAGLLDNSRAALLAVIPRRPALYDFAVNPDAAVSAALALVRDRDALLAAARESQLSAGAVFYAPHFTERIAVLMGGPGGRGPSVPWPPGGGVAGVEPPLRGVAEDRRAGARGETSPLLTTLDLPLQLFAEERLRTELRGLRNNRVTNGAILAIENETGAVRVYAGSASWFDDSVSGKIDGVRVRNQPGSCLKPFLYALALDSGFSAYDILPDLPSVFGGSEAYIPSNFNSRFNGPVRLRLALASSLNVPAVYLLERLGVRNFEEFLAGLGFDSVAESMGSHGAGLALGNAEVSLEELVRGFSAFPRGGSPAGLRWFEVEPYGFLGVLRPARASKLPALKHGEGNGKSQAIVGRSPGVPGEAPGIPRAAPGIPRAAPGVPREAPGVPREAPGVPRAAPGVPRAAPGVPREAPGVPREAPGVPREAPGVPREAPGIPREAPGTTAKAPGGGSGHQVMSPDAAWMIADILSDRGSRFVGFGPAPALTTEFPSMFKTGTANQFQHIWALGATRRFTVGVWMGNFSGETVVGRTGSSIPALIVRDLLAAMEESAGPGGAGSGEHPGGPAPASLRELRVCALSGMAAGPSCPGTAREWVSSDAAFGNSVSASGGRIAPCDWHLGGEVRFPPEYRAWLTERFRSGGIGNASGAGSGGGRIRSPLPGAVYYLDSGLPPEAQALRIETASFAPGAFVYDGGYLQGVLNQAGVFVLPLTRGRHTVLVEDEGGASARVEFEVR